MRNVFSKKKTIIKSRREHLSDLQLNQKAVVLALHNDNPALRRRLLDMGITKGVVLQIKKIAPMGDPVDIELRGYELCLRREDMRQIDIKVLEDENSISRQSK